MKLFNIFKFFSVYIDPFEKKVDKFLKGVKRKSKRDLEVLVQEDLVKLSIFLEYKFKGYKKLKKSYRKKLYQNIELIKEDFQEFFEEENDAIDISQHALSIPVELRCDDHFKYILAIMHYLNPDDILEYRESSNFEKILRNPKEERLVGDCNQIVTLYIYLFSLKYSVSELQIKILPDHVCLHYNGIDIETTSGSLADYDEYSFISSVEEIVATNILDISDPDEKQYSISAKNMLKSAELAYQFSSHRIIVEKNLFLAYHNVAVYYANQKNFSKAILFANKTGNTKMQRDIARMEASYFLKNKKYNSAAEKFRKINDRESEKACYQNELADLFGSIKNLKTIPEFKNKKATLRRMKELAIKVDSNQVLGFVNDVLKKINK